ncbi:MAG: Stealth CR1 domain-containing protein [Lachnospiraceae bacterium]|nr:Stealth CR1 domain-containing protein [Lachnospiraceae bacterium]
MTAPIDFVVTWVDGQDPAWLEEKRKYDPRKPHNDSSDNRYRDWGLLPYWFRGVEKFAPWVNHIYFVTCGHVPDWLNTGHPKLTHVSHSDYIPEEYLPTFNSNVIELFMNRIPGLSENFVLFNDDMFLTGPAGPDLFFRNDYPCDAALLDLVVNCPPDDVFPHILLNNAGIINKHFSKTEVLKKHPGLFLNGKYGSENIRTLLLMPFKYHSGFRDLHLPSSHRKRIFEEVWREEEEVLLATASHRFRDRNDVSHWLMKEWQICKGQIIPKSHRWGMHFELGEDNRQICQAIRRQAYPVICINDSDVTVPFEETRKELLSAFSQILPDRSHYERP